MLLNIAVCKYEVNGLCTFLTVVIPMCLSNSYKIHVRVKHNNLLYKIMLTAVSIILYNKLLRVTEIYFLYELSIFVSYYVWRGQRWHSG